MTPRVLGRELEAARLRSVDRFREGLTDAWNVARMYAAVRSKKGLPPLAKLLDEVKETTPKAERQTVAQLRTTLGILSEMGSVGRPRKGKA